MKKIIQKLEYILEIGGIKRDIVFLILSGAALLISMTDVVPLPFDAAWIAIVLCGIPIIIEAVIGLITAFDIKADVLVSLALIASILIKEDFAAGEVAFIMQLGALLEDLTVAKARAGIEKLVNLTPQTARIITEKEEKIIPAEAVTVGQRIRVLPGETVPVDGIIVQGETSINQAVMTGESLPVDKAAGDEVFSGTVNQFGSFEMEASKVGEDSSIQRMIRLVQRADAGKAKIVSLADRWATWIVVIALTAAVLTWLFTGEIIRSVTILVVFCPCALVLATPTAIMAAIGNSTRHGFLIKEGDALERLAGVSIMTFDKTGTLTNGKPEVISVEPAAGQEKTKLYGMVASAEQFSEHPLGKAIVESYKKEYTDWYKVENFRMMPGKGIVSEIEDKTISAGNDKLFEQEKIRLPQAETHKIKTYLNRGCTVIYTAVDKVYAGCIILSDSLRKESRAVLSELGALGVHSVLLTGDNDNTAKAIGEALGLHEICAECRPEDKLAAIASYQQNGETVCMIGDGINDAPALKKADVGIAMGGMGSDIAVDAADIALVDDEIKELPHLIALAKKMMRTIKLNLSFSMALNFLAIALAITGILNPVVGALVHNAGSVIVIINSAWLLRYHN